MSKDPYSIEVTQQSFVELQKFVRWMTKFSTPPIIIGGWAVYAYKRGKGSRDIDAVIHGQKALKQMEQYFIKHNYEPESVKKPQIPMFYTKKIKTKKGVQDDIYFELVNAKSERPSVDGLVMSMKWEWSVKNHIPQKVDGLSIQVPVLELLIVQKIIAALDRKAKMKTMLDISRTIDKVEKDYYDVASLVKDSDIVKGSLKNFLTISGASKYISKFLEGYNHPRNQKSLRELKINLQEIKEALIV